MNPAQSLGSTTAYNLALGGKSLFQIINFRGKWEKFNIIFFFFSFIQGYQRHLSIFVSLAVKVRYP